MKTLIRFENGVEVSRKEYTNETNAINAGNSWTIDCTVEQNRRKSRAYEVK